MGKTIEVGCYWANGCGSGETDMEVDSFDDFVAKLEKFFEDMCGMTAVESFDVYCNGEEYEWDNCDLPRNKDLSSVWKKVKKDLKIFFDACN